MRFVDRFDAGRQLVALLRSYRDRHPIVIGLVHGGVPVASEVAAALRAPLEVWVARKIRVPGNDDATLGAVSEGGALSLNREVVGRVGLSDTELAGLIAREQHEVARAARVLRCGSRSDLRGQVVILVDDGVATGATVRAAALSIRAQEPREIVLAVPVASLEAIAELRADFDHIVCLDAEPMLLAIGSRYRDFRRVSSAEIVSLLNDREVRQAEPSGSAAVKL